MRLRRPVERSLAPVLAVLVLACVVACERETGQRAGGDGRVEEELRLANREVERLEDEMTEFLEAGERLVEENARLAGEVERLAAQNARLESSRQESGARATELAARLREAKGAIAAEESAFDEYRTRHRETIRANAAGTQLDSLTTEDGTTYRDVTIQEVTEGDIRFTHAEGTATVSFEELPEEIQDRYAYSPTRFVDETISELQPSYLMTPEEIAARNPNPIATPQEVRPSIPEQIVVQQLAKLEEYIDELEARLRRAEAARDNVYRIDSGSNIKTSAADKRKMTRGIDVAVMEYRARLRGARRQLEVLRSHLPAEK